MLGSVDLGRIKQCSLHSLQESTNVIIGEKIEQLLSWQFCLSTLFHII
mgnify:CR=1 FL=1